MRVYDFAFSYNIDTDTDTVDTNSVQVGTFDTNIGRIVPPDTTIIDLLKNADSAQLQKCLNKLEKKGLLEKFLDMFVDEF